MDAFTPAHSRRLTGPPGYTSGKEFVRKLLTMLTVCVAIRVSTFSAWAELGSNMLSIVNC